jgi:hypothetical protein
MSDRSLYPALFVPILALLLLGTIGFFGLFATALMQTSNVPPTPAVAEAWSPSGVTGPTPSAAPLSPSEEGRPLPQGQPENQPQGSPSAAPQRYPDSAR